MPRFMPRFRPLLPLTSRRACVTIDLSIQPCGGANVLPITGVDIELDQRLETSE